MSNLPVQSIDSRQYFGITAAQPRSQLNMETFLQLLAVQLSNQNPLEPMSDRDFFAQMAQMGTVQGMDQLQKSMQMGQASALIGKTVTAVRPMTEGGANNLVTGVVRNVGYVNGDYVLQIQEPDGGYVDVKLGNIREVGEGSLSDDDYFIRGDQAILLMGRTIKAQTMGPDGQIREVVGVVKGIGIKDGERVLRVEVIGADQEPVEVSTKDVVAIIE